ncbi:prodigiosin synthesizing transferase PigC-like [Oppia nitens]|uniref:prodigiosin synthesizing transferase PigC-like n=1 Tax=Oppia nitens TaxID=1686743 RepID=UPI0023DC8368|nr:prodigiosin synthesizing transferase PigC-like [Oppia nitens]
MGLLLSIPVITLIVNKLIEINREINGRWIRYLSELWQLLSRRRHVKTNRIMIHDVFKDDVHHSGLIPFPHEWTYDRPSKDKNEDLLIYGVNSSKQSIYITINWKPNGVNNKNNATINMRIDDNNDCYTLEETQEVEYRKGEYRVSGLGLEILSAFRRKRIKFRGYLLKNNKEVVYIQFRFLWYAFSRIYDYTHDFDDYFMAQELAISAKSDKTESQLKDRFEDRFEQFGQIKGTFREEKTSERNLYFWGSISKKFLKTNQNKRTINRIFGYTKDGFGFHLGYVCNENGSEYRFGFLFRKMGRFFKLQKLSLLSSDFNDLKDRNLIHFTATFDNKDYNFVIEKLENNFAKRLIINDSEGMCFITEEIDTEVQQQIQSINNIQKDSSLVLGLNEESAQRVDLTGGKGSSLAVLMNLSQKLAKNNYKQQFSVANGVVVTTNAYEILLTENKDLLKAIENLEKSTQLSQKELKSKCDEVMDLIANQRLPQTIQKTIEEKLKNNFNDFENKLFAVRSSGASEDSEEMSAAGQMTTYLGVKGLDNIYSSVMKCWSSQFSHIAVEYKRGYGQPINSPMAVVIQEMIACESAGVMFTCDPITGDERVIEVTANYGLGESVVSASAEPDTIKLSVNIESNSLSNTRSIKSIESKTIGAKKTFIKLLDNGGTVEEEVNNNNDCSVSDEDLYRLGDLALVIHKHYGNARDIEWGLKGGEIFMLQSRPVTNLDNSYTDYEIMHESDSAHQTEFEIYTRTHWGENFPGASSWIVVNWFWSNKSLFVRGGNIDIKDYNPYVDTMGIQYNQIMFNLSNGQWDFFSDYPESEQSRQFVLSMFGHHFDDKDVLNCFKQRRQLKPKLTLWKKLKLFSHMIYFTINGPKFLMKDKTDYIERQKYDLVELKLRHHKTSKDIMQGILNNFHEIAGMMLKNHGPVSMGASIKNSLLRKMIGDNPDLDSDFNLMVSSCDGVISAEVPNYLREIAKLIKDKEKFRQLTDEEAVQVLRNGNDEASKKFEKFIEIHGHRGYRELDPMYQTWKEDPIPCIRNIKALLTGNESQLEPKVGKSIDEVMNELKTPLSSFKKYLIRNYLLPWSRRGVGYREHSKYFMIWLNNNWRKGFRYLSKQMVSEGLIPSAETFFYLTPDEVIALCNGDRNPLILQKTRHRKRLYPKMDKYKFEEFIKGPEMIPKNFEDRIILPTLSSGMVQMKGTPVSNGTVKARVCVSEDITDADNIQPGDILITYSTDIGWSPYFPLLSGLITEIGGTISHGSVIAREYGIPCLIAIDGVCRAFKTGDICVLDTQSATITKVE